MKRQNPERAFHAVVADYLRASLPAGWRWSTFPAGELRTERTAALLKRLGVQPGWPDIIVQLPDGRDLHLELKAPKGVLSPDQKAHQAACEAVGAPYVVARTLDDVRAAVRAYGLPTRERAAV